MIKIECDICSCLIKSSEQIDLTQVVDTLLTSYGKMNNPDICFNCLDDLSKDLKETIIQWKLREGKK